MSPLQDIILGLFSVVLTLGLVPSIIGKNKPELATCIFSAGSLAVIAYTYYTMAMPFAVSSALLGALAWSVLVLQQYKKV